MDWLKPPMKPMQVDRSGVGEGRYANYAEIGHNASEFVFDFGQLWLNGDPAHVYLRVITSPDTAQCLFDALDEALEQYRSKFGPVRREEQVTEKEAPKTP